MLYNLDRKKKNAYAYATYKTQMCSVGVSVYALNAYLHFKIEIAQFNDEWPIKIMCCFSRLRKYEYPLLLEGKDDNVTKNLANALNIC